ncbi:MAG: DUF4276 family protein [Candidatus Schekmanbacteria bacterium]|nr:DUF4276 family protein [Candidatus Schekmanbacteria bacterium]
MKELVFLLEEESAKAMLESLLPRILHPDIRPRYVPFEGKQDLERQMVRRLRGYANPHARFIVLRDQDSAPDCGAVKEKLIERCQEAGKAGKTLVRIACTELQAFYLADLRAVEQGLGLDKLASQQGSAKFRYPDGLANPSKELTTLTAGEYQKVSGSRSIGRFLDPANERSPSFRSFIKGIRRMESEMLALPDA